MGLMGCGGYVVLRSGGQVGKVSAYFRETLQSPTLTPFMDWLPLPSQVSALSSLEAFPDVADYAKPYVGPWTRYFGIKARERRVRFHSQLDLTEVWGYLDHGKPDPPDGGRAFDFCMPKLITGQGPGAGVVIRHFNDPLTGLREGRAFGVPTTSVHFHGGHQPALADGFPDNIPVPPGPVGFDRVVFGGYDEHRVANRGHYDYCHPMRDVGFSIDGVGTPEDRPSLLWFHDHFLDFTGPNSYRGLANVCPVFDEEIDTGNETDYLTAGSRALGLPSGDFDITMAFQDKLFDVDGSLIFNSFDHDGFLGDRFTVNGLVQPKLEVKRRKYRFRFLNASNARMYQFFLTNRSGKTFPMTQIATEGGLLSSPWRGVDGRGMQSFMLSMAERVEVVVDFGDDSFGAEDEIFIENRLVQTEGRKPDGLTSSGTKIVQLLLTNHVEDPSRVPAVLRERAPLTDAMISAAPIRRFRFDRSHGAWTINNQLVNLEKPLATVPLSTGHFGTPGFRPVIFRLENNSGGWWHPIHIHSEFMRVLKRNGRTPPPYESGADGRALKDTILLRGGESVDVYYEFRDFAGPFLIHCHNMEHEDMAMMARFDVVE
jgi:FtsP/CotA-like multicopper oxidase with cupredoxin domain